MAHPPTKNGDDEMTTDTIKALMTALVWMAGNNPPTVSNAELCEIDKIIKGD